ncbi:protein tyrosine phosphatase domain-containing protein 1-like [Protopterus annectens]|uniref:protein tyrosine phosphatase domain-containing protein 1-like n=1 Tax=Protopterus annectens TaxID=7888 RepID=UPI001CF9ED8E|nr:protein tyrosine phosphatase domain-containing protein 1-like [Protopterus annectens]
MVLCDVPLSVISSYLLCDMNSQVPIPQPSYSVAKENLIKAVPAHLICSLVCGGKECRYEGPVAWAPEQQAVRGLYSSWVTEDILAMARPSSTLIKKYQILQQFIQLNIKSVINLQIPGEHANCGDPLEKESGFSYLPETFMDHGIYFFNFGMPDFGVASLIRMLDGVKIMAFALQEGKVAIHCHAGLGRTGVLIACYLLYATRVQPNEAIQFVRIKRPSSIQTRAQINLVYDFAQFLASHRVVYANSLTGSYTLSQFLIRQQQMLHGYEARSLKNIPKIVYVVCKRLSHIALSKKYSNLSELEQQREATSQALTELIQQTLESYTFTSHGDSDEEGAITSPKLVTDPDNALYPDIQKDLKSSFNVLPSLLSSAIPTVDVFLFRRRKIIKLRRTYSDSDIPYIFARQQIQLQFQSAKMTEKDGGLSLQNKKASVSPSSPHQSSSKSSPKLMTAAQQSGENKKPKYDTKSTTKTDAEGTSCAAVEKKSEIASISKVSNLLSVLPMKEISAQNESASQMQQVAMAMADRDPLDTALLQKIRQLQAQLNVKEGGWAKLAMECNAMILSGLLWNWLEHLKEPVLTFDDVIALSRSQEGQQTLALLQKHQQEPIVCILDCISKLRGLNADLEGAIIYRLISALTQCDAQEVTKFPELFKYFRKIVREKRSQALLKRGIAKTTTFMKISSSMMKK